MSNKQLQKYIKLSRLYSNNHLRVMQRVAITDEKRASKVKFKHIYQNPEVHMVECIGKKARLWNPLSAQGTI